MILDPILRFNWIFYAIYSSELQHSAILSFFVGFSEVCRRGMWTLFRVENEHCTNVGRFRASRDVPLPYEFGPPSPSSPEEEVEPEIPTQPSLDISRYTTSSRHTAMSSNLEAQASQGSLRRRGTAAVPNTPIQRGIARVGTIMGLAHAQDFERKRRPSAPVPASPYQDARTAGEESSDEEDEEEEQDQDNEDGQHAKENLEDMQQAGDILRRHQSATNNR